MALLFSRKLHVNMVMDFKGVYIIGVDVDIFHVLLKCDLIYIYNYNVIIPLMAQGWVFNFGLLRHLLKIGRQIQVLSQQ